MMTTAFHESPSTIHIEMPFAVNDGISSVAMADKAQYDYYDSETAVSIASLSIVIDTESYIVSVASNKASSAGITKRTTLYASLSAVKMMTTDMNTVVYFAVIDAQSSAGITKTKTLYTSPSVVMVKIIPYESNTDGRTLVVTTSPYVSIADKATSTAVTIMTTSVSVGNKATSAVTKTLTGACHSSNYFPLILPFESSCQFG